MPSANAAPSAESPSLTELFSRLPLEVLGLIVEQVARIRYQPKYVAPLCLISKTFLPRVQRKLYHTAPISYRRWDVGEDEQPLDPQPVLEVGDTIRHTLRKAPHLRRLVRHLTVYLEFWTYTEEDEEGVLLSLKKVLRVCPDFTELSVDHHAAWEATDDVAATIAELERTPPIEKLDISFVGPGAISLLKKLPHLRELKMDPGDRNDEPLDFPPSFPCSLTTLSSADTPLPLFQPLTSHSFSTLQELYVGSDTLAQETVSSGFHNFIALRNLDVVLRSEDADSCESIAFAIASLPALQQLSLSAFDSQLPSPHPLATALLPRLPAPLRELRFSGLDVHPASIMQLFHHRDITPPPHLKLIYLGPAVNRALQGTDEGERLWWETVVQCCAAAGVVVKSSTF